MPVSVVTDSTAYLAPGLAATHGVAVAPLHVTIDGVTGRDGVDVGPAELTAALRPAPRAAPARTTLHLGARALELPHLERRHAAPLVAVSTSMCSPAELEEVYGGAAPDDTAPGSGVLAVHLSRRLSGTWDAARLAAGAMAARGVTVRVVDSRSAAMGLGFPVLAAARAAAAGADLDGAYRAAVDVAGRCRTLLCVDTLEHLRRGGRIGSATALLGTALAMKPLLHLVDGRIESLEKVRTTARAGARLVELAVAAAGTGPVAVAVHHLAAPERAAELADRLRARLSRTTELHVSEVGAVLGAHLGPGVLGVVVCPGGAGEPD